MYGPATAAPPPLPPHRPGPGAWGVTVRLLFASFPLWSLGLLAWVPSLRFAVLRGRRLDWAVFGLSVALTVVYIVLLFSVPADDPEGESTASAFAGLYIFALMIGATVHAILGDRFPRAPRPIAYASAAPPPYGYGYPPAAPARPAGPAAAAAPTVSAAPSAYRTPPPPPTVPAPARPAAPPPSSHRMRQVASELDELDEFLRKRGNDR